MIKNSDLIEKELVKTLSYTTITKNRDASADVIIDGRNYLKFGVLQAVTIVGNVYKVWNTKTKMNEYWLFAGLAKQNPVDLNCDKQIANETAMKYALMDPFMIMQVGKSFGQHSFSDMMAIYVDDLDLEFIKTSQELKNIQQ